MKPPADVAQVISAHTTVVDAELTKFFAALPDSALYDHLAYFMGFKNEELQPEVTYGGKRFRSSLMVMLGEYYGHKATVLPFALALELYHNFTLIHDDVVDRDTHRRGRPTVWHLFGHDHAINDGDAQLLLVAEVMAKAAVSCKEGAKTQVFLLEQFRIVVEGQYLDFELTKASLEEVTTTAYEEMIRCKTAELIVAAAVGAGMIAGESETELGSLRQYAHCLGMAYQICDDVVSIWATRETTGKRNYGDIKERKKTLPVLYAYEHVVAADRDVLCSYYHGTDELCTSSSSEYQRTRNLVSVSGQSFAKCVA
jgi:geranylgeranyl diphosphate synthase type I